MHEKFITICTFIIAAGMVLVTGIAQSQPLFSNIIDSTGIEAMTTRGIAVGDYNGDGWLDLYLCSNPGPSYLYRNDGHNRFTDVTSQTGVGIEGLSAAPTFVDFDNDGDLDLYVAAYYDPNRLFRNDGGHFVDIAAAAGVQVSGLTTNQATWGDYDRDGWVDLLIANSTEVHSNILYHNNGDGTFSDVTAGAGISGPAFTRAAIWGDYNNDSWPDIYIHGIQECALYTNSHGGLFWNTNQPSALDGFYDGLACAWRDIDNNGFLDLTLGARDASMRILLNQNGLFDLDNRFIPGTIPRNNGGATYIDIDNDGYPDLYSKELYGKEYLYGSI